MRTRLGFRSDFEAGKVDGAPKRGEAVVQSRDVHCFDAGYAVYGVR